MFLLTVTAALATFAGAFFLPERIITNLALVTFGMFAITAQVWLNRKAKEWEKADDMERQRVQSPGTR